MACPRAVPVAPGPDFVAESCPSVLPSSSPPPPPGSPAGQSTVPRPPDRSEQVVVVVVVGVGVAADSLGLGPVAFGSRARHRGRLLGL